MTRAVRPPQRRDAERSRRAILDAALEEFSELGHAGARIDAIAARAGVSKPLIYSYFGDKDALYMAALREAYVQIRSGENGLDLESKDPESAIRALVAFTLEHFRSKPWFVSMLNTENLRGGATIRQMRDVSEIQSPLVVQLQKILERGAAAGAFRSGVDPVDLYIAIASLCYFPISNQHTLRVVFDCPIDAEWLARRERDTAEMVLGFLRPRESVNV
ncbi:MAG TPA: TetR family transcriptional regulator [Amaricoccus sp.]|uniref:TetR family transcriptional regulator n=1 Tax=Amaricoccus sp. TaxID=1872485 RepID=UPI002B5EF051|nr:TetR family transcriptional regulator [Amaricoccus sp.]HMQ94834.1 TetR family transcriptional regulator [Amaricoccus sp.]HMR54459.1 TetR family transcriptional regulator [Amaricoccus sp.]HMR61456.1 TetR family transcriptional regulator [Amaricoccus sp.]HMU01491.1 TetR family transcriptional regulator [Amaricoccus sp.]